MGGRVGNGRRARRGPVAPARARLGLLVGAAVIAVLALAWIDGGEEPIRPIAEPVETPVAVASGEGAR
ncbi:MAG: hypothetical protein G9473_05990 [Erythrobacter sp.]|nr:MAG: hypothetical protein G9473_05990 [Erythrobacter sp.]